MPEEAVRLAVGTLLAAVLALLCGCQVHVTSSRPPDIARSRLVNHTLTLDLRRHPSRDDLGMNPTTSFAGYGSTSDPVGVVVELPGSTLAFPAASITMATDDAGGGTDPRPASHAPRFFSVYVGYPDRAAAHADALTRASALGLRPDQVDEALGSADGHHDVHGVPDDWRSARLVFSHLGDEPGYTACYFFDLDVFHNPVLDAIKHDDTVDVDLRTPPSRDALGFLPGYQLASVEPDPGHRLLLRLRTPRGSAPLQLPDAVALGSDSDGPDGAPTRSFVTLCGSPGRLRSGLIGVADVLGLDADRVEALPTSRRGPAGRVILTGRTSSFDSEIRYDGTDQPGLDACVRLRLTYRR